MINQTKVQLLQRGKFIISVDDKQYHGKFNMMALEDYCLKNNIPGPFVLADSFRVGLLPSKYAELIICGIEQLDKHHNLTVKDVLEWMDVMGGFTSNEFLKLMAQAMRTFSRPDVTGLDMTDEEKKIFGIEIAGNPSDTNAGKPDLKRKRTTKAH
jgi:hypothetical protein